MGVLANVLFLFDVLTSPPVLFGMVVAGYLTRAVGALGAKSDDDFPPAPPACLPRSV